MKQAEGYTVPSLHSNHFVSCFYEFAETKNCELLTSISIELSTQERNSTMADSKMPNPDHDPATISIHADDTVNPSDSLSPPIYQTSTFKAETADGFLDMATEPFHSAFYARYGNPTSDHARVIIAQLEGAEDAILTASGMGAFTTIMLSLLESGGHVVAQKVHYGGTIGLLENVMHKFGVSVTFVEQTDPDAFQAAILPQTKLIIVETPTNPVMAITDLSAIATIGKKHGIITLADNTFASPINQRPLDHGIDIVYHSATKYLGGHHDLLAGAIATRRDLLEPIWRTSLAVGAALNGFDSWLLVRGLRTLKLRVNQHNSTALAVAKMLESHPRIARVYYPGLESHPQHALAMSQMTGFSGMLSFEIDGDMVQANRFMDALTLVDRAASLGGVHSLIVSPAAMLAAVMTEDDFKARGVAPGLVRLSVGLEDTDDLIADIQQALASI